MKLQNKSFHKSWISSVQNRERNTTKTLSIKKYILKIIFLSLIILTSIRIMVMHKRITKNISITYLKYLLRLNLLSIKYF